jgi:hypothetical protein
MRPSARIHGTIVVAAVVAGVGALISSGLLPGHAHANVPFKQKVKQKAAVTELVLAGSLGCGKKSRLVSNKKKRGRGLWGDGDGKHTTKGDEAPGARGAPSGSSATAATARPSSRWCAVVSFRDFVDNKTVIVRAGESYATDTGK